MAIEHPAVRVCEWSFWSLNNAAVRGRTGYGYVGVHDVIQQCPGSGWILIDLQDISKWLLIYLSRNSQIHPLTPSKQVIFVFEEIEMNHDKQEWRKLCKSVH